MNLSKRKELIEIVSIAVRNELALDSAKETDNSKEEENDEFKELRRAANALAWFVERVSCDSGMTKKQLPEAAYAVLPEAARVLKEIIEIMHL